MTVSSSTSRVSYSGDGSTTAFSVPYYFLAQTDLQVVLVSDDGTETTKTISTHYTVTGAGVPAGGTVTMITAPASGETLLIQRRVPATQLTDYAPNDPFPAETHERALDKLTMITQQLQTSVDRSARFPDGYVGGADPTLPIPGAGEFLRWNNAGLALETVAASPDDDTYTASGTGAVARSWSAKVGETVSFKDFGAVVDGVTDDTEDMQAAADAHESLYADHGVYVNDEIEVPGSLRLRGDGLLSQLDAGFRLDPDATGAVSLDLDGLAFSRGSAIAADQACEADIKAVVRAIDVNGGDSIVALRNSGELSAIVSGVRGKDLQSVGVALGYNDETYQAGWKGAIVTDVIVDGLFPDDAASHYGIISYVPNSVIANYVIDNVGNTGGGAGTEGVYTKARGSVVANGVHRDAGLDEGMLNLKGGSKGATDNPLGYNLVAVGHVFEWTDAYKTAAGSALLTGANLANDNLLFGGALFFNGGLGRAIHTASVEIDSSGIFDIAVLDGDYADGGVYHQNSGRGHTVRGATVRNITGPAFKARGAETDSTFDYSDILIDGALYGWIIRPSANDIADYAIRGAVVRSTTGTVFLFDGAFNPRSVTLENVEIGDFRSRATFNYADTGIPNRWHIRNLHGHGRTTDATARNFASLKIPPSKPLSIVVRATAHDGTDALLTERRALFFNSAGTVTLQGSVQTVGEVNDAPVSWDIVFDISGETVTVQVQGETATNVDWHVSIDADTP